MDPVAASLPQNLRRIFVATLVEDCDDLILNLDLRGLNLSAVSTVIRNCKIVTLETVLTDYRQSFAQTFNLNIHKVKNATLSGVSLVSSVMVSVKLVQSSLGDTKWKGICNST